MKKIAVINDLSGLGKCSLTAALPVISALKTQCCPLTTAVLSNQTGYNSYYCKDLTNEMPLFIEEWKKLHVSFDGILTGFISNSLQGEIIYDFIQCYKTESNLIVVDPVMADDGEIYDCYDNDCVNAIKHLTTAADIITPNLTELCILCEKNFNQISSLCDDEKINAVKSMCEKYTKKSSKKVVVSGIKLDNNIIANAVFEENKFNVIKKVALKGSFSGTGDILSSFITAKCVNGESLYNAVMKASDFIEKSIIETINDTGGNYNVADGVHFEKFLTTLGE